MTAPYHTPVLLEEALGFLITDPGGVYVDGTLGGGGHAEAICKRLKNHGRLIAFDADADAIHFASNRLQPYAPRVTFVHGNVSDLVTKLEELEVGSIHGLLLDLGVSSYQLDDETKGFSFRGNEQIDMRMDRRQTLSGWDVVNTYEEERLAKILWEYGEERNSRRIAKRIVGARPIDTTQDFVNVIEKAVGQHFLVKTLARVFQAVRIEVNDELNRLSTVLHDAINMLSARGRLVVISYHSLEDRIVKNTFREASRTSIPSGNKYIPDTPVQPTLRLITKSPVQAGEAETRDNPRARSAKMRVAERISLQE